MSSEKSMLCCMGFEKKYSDGSGVETAVRYFGENEHRDAIIEFESQLDKVQIPADKMDWLITCLKKIQDMVLIHDQS